jgi:hypothetical protein
MNTQPNQTVSIFLNTLCNQHHEYPAEPNSVNISKHPAGPSPCLSTLFVCCQCPIYTSQAASLMHTVRCNLLLCTFQCCTELTWQMDFLHVSDYTGRWGCPNCCDDRPQKISWGILVDVTWRTRVQQRQKMGTQVIYLDESSGGGAMCGSTPRARLFGFGDRKTKITVLWDVITCSWTSAWGTVWALAHTSTKQDSDSDLQ